MSGPDSTWDEATGQPNTGRAGRAGAVTDGGGAPFFLPSPAKPGEGLGVRALRGTGPKPSPPAPLPQSRERVAKPPPSITTPGRADLTPTALGRTAGD